MVDIVGFHCWANGRDFGVVEHLLEVETTLRSWEIFNLRRIRDTR
jgi:hypothetical protein